MLIEKAVSLLILTAGFQFQCDEPASMALITKGFLSTVQLTSKEVPK